MRYLFALLFILSGMVAGAQPGADIIDYINNYKKLAMDEMIRTGIPASITLAHCDLRVLLQIVLFDKLYDDRTVFWICCISGFFKSHRPALVIFRVKFEKKSVALTCSQKV